MPLTVKDLEKVQVKLGDEYRVELVDGRITVMSPSGYESDEGRPCSTTNKMLSYFEVGEHRYDYRTSQ